MRKIFWIVILLIGYLWVIFTGHEHLVLDQSKHLYNIVAEWFSDAEVDYHVEQKPQPAKKKRPRRWD